MEKVSGNLRGLKASELRMLERLMRRRVQPRQLVTFELVDRAAELSRQLNRDLGLLVSRRGHVERVIVADGQLELPAEIERYGAARLSGDRLVVVRSKGGGLGRAEVVLLQRHRLDLLAVIEPEPADMTRSMVWMASLAPTPDAEGHYWRLDEPRTLREVVELVDVPFLIDEIEREFARYATAIAVGTGQERAFLVGLQTEGQTPHEAEESLEELYQLALTAGAEVLGRVMQRRRQPDAATMIGSGKAEELALLCQEQGATTVLLDAELSPSQQTNLERIIGVKIVDRTGLILDIFAQRARSREGKIQVELA
ncbi:MAG TPA: hypothetical protein V6D05_17775, partial [Stenomitos sp.]